MLAIIKMAPLALCLAACANAKAPAPAPSAPKPVIASQAVDIGLGQRAYADGPIIEVRDILEDSRCPQNARCVWAGRLKLAMIWHRGNGAEHAFELTLGEPTHIADGHIQITAATPPRLAGAKAPKPTDYRFSFRFDGGY